MGGDAIIPFYRKFDPTKTVLDHWDLHTASNVTETDAINNYLFTDIIYRDYDNKNWDEGKVEDIYVGRIAGVNIPDVRALLLSSDKNSLTSSNVIKLENNARNGELTHFENSALNVGYMVKKDIDNTTIDLSLYWLGLECFFPGLIAMGSDTPDPARWNNNFSNLFTGQAQNISNFDVFRLMCHGQVTKVQDTIGNEYFTGKNIYDSRNDINNYFSSFNPFLIFDACLVGIVDGTYNTGLFNSLLPLNVRGIMGASAVTWSGWISDFNDKFSESFFQKNSSGKSVVYADKKFPGLLNSDKDKLTIYQMNLFGLPWSSISPPGINAKNMMYFIEQSKAISNIESGVQGTSNKTLSVDASVSGDLNLYFIWRFENVEIFF